MKKKIVGCLIVITLLCNDWNMNMVCGNIQNENVKVDECNVEQLIVNATLDWLQLIEPDKNFCVGDIVEIEISEPNKLEYTASVFNDVIPYGYVVIDVLNDGAVVVESNVSLGREGLYASIVDEVVEKSGEKRRSLKIGDSITKIAPLQYGLKYEDSKGNINLTDNYGNEIDDEEKIFTSTKYETAWAIYIDKKEWKPSKYKVNESEYITLKKYQERPMLLSEQYIEVRTKKYCCVVQAMLQIANMEKLVTYSTDDIVTAYNKLWNYAKITETAESKKNKSSNKVMYGQGTTKNAAKALIKLAKEKGYKGTEYKGMEKNPSVSWIKNKLEYNRSILMGYGINVGGKRSGHEISILGYMKAKKVSSGNTWDYLMVYNSWDSTVSYLNYSCVDFMDCQATYFWVKK